MKFTFTLEAWSAWSPFCQSKQDWQNWADSSISEETFDAVTPDVQDIPMMLRRRLSPLLRMAFRTALDVDDGRENLHLVFASQHGDAEITPEILRDIAKNQPVSPAKFSISVHNALAGMYSIHTKNTAPHTMISAGDKSFVHGFLEAQAILHNDPAQSVLFVYYDVNLPDFFGDFCEEPSQDIAIALLISAATDATDDQMLLTTENVVEPPNPQYPGLEFIRFMLGRRSKWHSQVGQGNWVCKRHVA